MPDITDHGWNVDGSIRWIVKPFPDDINDLLIDEGEENKEKDDSDSDDGFRSDIERDEDD